MGGMPPALPQPHQQWQQQQAFEHPGRSGAGPYQLSELAPGHSGASLQQRYAQALERPGASSLQRLSTNSLQHSEQVLKRGSFFRPEASSRMQRQSERPGDRRNAPEGRRNSAYPLASKPPSSFAPESSSLDDYKEFQQFSKRGYSKEPVEGNLFTDYQDSFKDGDFTNDLLLNTATVHTHELNEEVDLPLNQASAEAHSQTLDFELEHQAQIELLTSDLGLLDPNKQSPAILELGAY
ncbi:MAG: hypothetical protein M1829_000430 [Trizodia sp. TS-e1964]|nr:MAG: hypothetical protein M1829_000430 [Trizodia sp. TS-e1964]